MKEYVYEFLGGRQNHRVDPVTMKNEFTIDNLIVVYYNRFSPRFRFTGERHNFYEFYYVAENEMVITVDGENFLLNAGEFICVPPMRWHVMEPHETYATGITISFDATGYLEEIFNGKLSPFEKQLLSNILNIYAKNYSESEFRLKMLSDKNADEEKDFGYGQALRVNIECLMLNILQEHIRNEKNKTRPVKTYNVLAQNTLSYLEQHFKENPSLREIADNLNYSVPHICRVFKQNYNESIVNYITKLKIDEAMRLIEENNMTFREISDSLNFDNVAYFTRIFKQQTGMTPSAYRKFSVWAHLLNSQYLPENLKL